MLLRALLLRALEAPKNGDRLHAKVFFWQQKPENDDLWFFFFFFVLQHKPNICYNCWVLSLLFHFRRLIFKPFDGNRLQGFCFPCLQLMGLMRCSLSVCTKDVFWFRGLPVRSTSSSSVQSFLSACWLPRRTLSWRAGAEDKLSLRTWLWWDCEEMLSGCRITVLLLLLLVMMMTAITKAQSGDEDSDIGEKMI